MTVKQNSAVRTFGDAEAGLVIFVGWAMRFPACPGLFDGPQLCEEFGGDHCVSPSLVRFISARMNSLTLAISKSLTPDLPL